MARRDRKADAGDVAVRSRHVKAGAQPEPQRISGEKRAVEALSSLEIIKETLYKSEKKSNPTGRSIFDDSKSKNKRCMHYSDNGADCDVPNHQIEEDLDEGSVPRGDAAKRFIDLDDAERRAYFARKRREANMRRRSTEEGRTAIRDEKKAASKRYKANIRADPERHAAKKEKNNAYQKEYRAGRAQRGGTAAGPTPT